MSTTASARASQATSASPPRNELPPAMSLDAIVNATKGPTASLQPDDLATVDGRSVIGSVTSDRRKPRKLDIRHISRPEGGSLLNAESRIGENDVAEPVQPPSQDTSLRRKPRKLNRDSFKQPEAREESIGGVALNQPATGASDEDPTSTTQEASRDEDKPRIVELPDEEEETPQPVKRRPRKLNRNRSSNAVAGPQPAALASAPVTPRAPAKTEIDALKERVRDLEGQVKELYERPQLVTARSPRRRGKGRKASADGLMTPTEELSQLQAELVDAQNELAVLKIQEGAAIAGSPNTNPGNTHSVTKTPQSSRFPRTRPHADSHPATEDDEIEDIPRTAEPGIDSQTPTSQKAVTLSGSYKIRLPNSLDMKDVKALQDGVTSATNIAKSIAATRGAVPRGAEPAGDGKSWGEWFGSYSQSIARIMHNVETEAAVESSPVAPRRVQSTTSSVKRTPQRPRAVVASNSLVTKRSPVPDRGRSAQMAPQMADTLMK